MSPGVLFPLGTEAKIFFQNVQIEKGEKKRKTKLRSLFGDNEKKMSIILSKSVSLSPQ